MDGQLSPELTADLQVFLTHLRVERRLAARTLAMYTEALLRLQTYAAASKVELRKAQPHHIRGWVAQLRVKGLAPRSIAIDITAAGSSNHSLASKPALTPQ